MANTGVPVAAMAAAAWSWVEKMLHEAHRTCAPRACKVSISTAVWIVMCRLPVMRAPFSGWVLANSSRIAIRPGISVSAMRISLRPQSARAMSAMAESAATGFFRGAFMGANSKRRCFDGKPLECADSSHQTSG